MLTPVPVLPGQMQSPSSVPVAVVTLPTLGPWYSQQTHSLVGETEPQTTKSPVPASVTVLLHSPGAPQSPGVPKYAEHASLASWELYVPDGLQS